MNGADQCFLWFQGMRSHELSPKLIQKLVFTTWVTESAWIASVILAENVALATKV